MLSQQIRSCQMINHNLPVVKPAVQNTYKHYRSRKCIRWHIPVHAYLFYLGHLSLLGLHSKTRRQSNSSIFCSFKSYNPETFMSSAANAFVHVHATYKHSQKVPHTRSGMFWFPPDRFPLFKHHSIALVLLYNIRLE